MHGDLVREQLKRRLRQPETDASNLLKLARDGVGTYTRAREYAQTSSGLKTRVFAYIGEALPRVMLLKEEDDKQLKLDDDPLLRDSEQRTLKILDELETIFSTQTIRGLDVDATRRRALIVRIDLFELSRDSDSSPFHLQTACTRDEEICSLPYVIRALDKSGGQRRRAGRKLRHWSELRYHELDVIIKTLVRRHKSQTRLGTRLSSDFDNLLCAMIAIRQVRYAPEPRKDISLDLAIEYSRQWVTEYPRDNRPYFLLGVFLFVKAVQSDKPRPDLEKDSIMLLDKCKKRCEETAHGGERFPNSYAKWKYYVGTESGLAAVMDRHHPMIDDLENGTVQASPWNARNFEGILQSRGNYVNVSLAGKTPLSVRVTPSSKTDNLFLRREQTPKVTFFLVFSYGLIQALDLIEVR